MQELTDAWQELPEAVRGAILVNGACCRFGVLARSPAVNVVTYHAQRKVWSPRTNGGFAIRCPEATTIDQLNQLWQSPAPEVPAVVPSPPGAAPGSKLPPDLARVAAVWNDLPEAIKAGVLALVRAAAGAGVRS